MYKQSNYYLTVIFVIFVFCFSELKAQDTDYKFQCSTDSSRLVEVINLLPNKDLIEIAMLFKDTPYEANMLNTGGDEFLVITASHLDCQIYVETVLSLYRLQLMGIMDLEHYKEILQCIRYRGCNSSSYVSRLHYFIDWIYVNEKNDVLYDITKQIGGIPYNKEINFMTKHPQYYKPLDDTENVASMRQVESDIQTRKYYYIPKEDVNKRVNLIHTGDIIAITTPEDGLDITHVGFAYKVKGNLYLLHASSDLGKVVISKETLKNYLMRYKNKSGIMVLRARS